MSDPEDLLSEALLNLYNIAPITVHSSTDSRFHYISALANNLSTLDADNIEPPVNISLRTPDTQAANWSLHASAIWVSSLYLADHLDDLHLDRRILSASRRGEPLRILELGAGAGLPSILIAKHFSAVNVTASDYPDPELISTLSENIETNGVASRCRVIPHAWGSDTSALCSHPDAALGYDVILAADTLWNPDLRTPFLTTLSMALRRTEESRIYLVAGLHTGRYTLQGFLDAVFDVGFVVEEVMEREVYGDSKRDWNVEREEDEQERRQWVLWISLKWF